MIEVVKLNPFKSASFGAIMYTISAFGVVNYVQNWLYIFPILLGSWIGTYITIKYEKYKKDKNIMNI